MKVAFFGSSSLTSSVSEALNKDFNLIKSFTNPETEIKKGELEELEPDLFVVASFGKILPKEIINIPKYGSLNIHPSLLPNYRGPSPIQTAILNGDKNTGVTIIKMDEEIDHGPILFQKEEVIQTDDTFLTLYERLFKIGADNLTDTINNYINDNLQIASQNHSEATFTKLLKKANGQIDIHNPPPKEKLERMIRAFYPWPGVFFKGKLGGAERIVKLLPDNQIQVEGKKSMSYKDFINGYAEAGKILSKLGLA